MMGNRKLLVAIKLESFVLEHLVRIGDALHQPLIETVENLVGRCGVSYAKAANADRHPVKIRPVIRKILKIGLQKMKVLRIKGVQIAVENLAGEGGVEGLF